MEGRPRKDPSKIQRTFDRYYTAISNLDSQTALAINTNVIVAETNAIVSNINRIMVEGQGGNNSGNLMVSDARSISTAE